MEWYNCLCMKLSVDVYFKSTNIVGAMSLRATNPFSVITVVVLGRTIAFFDSSLAGCPSCFFGLGTAVH